MKTVLSKWTMGAWALAVGLILVLSGPASATTITYSANSGLFTATGIFTLTDNLNGTETLNITITNTTSSGPTNTYISAFGFDTSPQAALSNFGAGAVFDNYIVGYENQINASGGFHVDICVFAGNNCTAANGGLLHPGTDSVSFLLTGNTPFILSNYTMKFAGALSSFETQGCEGACNAVPEPASLLLMGTGLVGLVAWRRKQTA